MVLLDAPPSVGALEELEAIAVDGLSARELGALLVSIGLIRGRVDACEARVLAAFERVGGAKNDGAADTAAWLSRHTKAARRDAKRSRQRAAAVAALPELGELLSSGAVSAGHVEAIGAVVPDTLLARAGELVAAASSCTPERLRQKAHQFVLDADGGDAASRSKRQRGAQKLTFFGADNGMGAMYGEWESERLASIRDAVDLVADDLWRAEHPTRNPQRWDDTTLKYRRADALYELAKRVLGRQDLLTSTAPTPSPTDAGDVGSAVPPAGAAHGKNEGENDGDVADVIGSAVPPAGAAHGKTRASSRECHDAELTAAARVAARAPRPLAMLLIDYQTARGDLAARGICELADGTPIPAETMRRLLCDADIVPAVLNDRGEVLDMGRKIHLPTMPQRRAVFLRDRHCQFPGCDRPAKWSDVHHIVWWQTGGRTDYSNLLLLCGFHHHLVHEGGWRIRGTALDFTIYRPDGELFERVTRGPP
jgi:hypothetical protein